MLVQPSKAAVTPILSLLAICEIVSVNWFADFGSILSLIARHPGSFFNAGAIKLKRSCVSLFSINEKGSPFETIIRNVRFSKCDSSCFNSGRDI